MPDGDGGRDKKLRSTSMMQPDFQHCSHCGADIREDRHAGLTYCSACGRDPFPEETPHLDMEDVADKGRWRVCFWLCFLLTPVAVFFGAMGARLLAGWLPGFGGGNMAAIVTNSAATLVLLALGLLGTGYCRMKFEKRYHEAGDGFVRTMTHAGRVLFIYVLAAIGIVALLRIF